jgi:hypothetical protein
MTVYLVVKRIACEGEDVMEVCSTRERAEAKAKRMVERYTDDYYYREWEQDANGDWRCRDMSIVIREWQVDEGAA